MPNTHPHYILTARNLTFRPTRWGVLYGFITILLLLSSMNYSISLGYSLSFLMIGLIIIALLHAWRNMSNLEIDTSLLSPSVFMGETIFVNVNIINKKSFPRYTINIAYPAYPAIIEDIASINNTLFSIPINTTKRGWLHLPKLQVFSEFPTGLFRVSASLYSHRAVLVYARPQPPQLETSQTTDLELAANLNTLLNASTGDDEFNGHRTYQDSDSMQHIDWKASSRHGTLLTKQFITNRAQSVWLDWCMTEGLSVKLHRILTHLA
jgi:uncharacterized protein (DUF58 family)